MRFNISGMALSLAVSVCDLESAKLVRRREALQARWTEAKTNGTNRAAKAAVLSAGADADANPADARRRMTEVPRNEASTRLEKLIVRQ
jgi:hypothetical protein